MCSLSLLCLSCKCKNNLVFNFLLKIVVSIIWITLITLIILGHHKQPVWTINTWFTTSSWSNPNRDQLYLYSLISWLCRWIAHYWHFQWSTQHTNHVWNSIVSNRSPFNCCSMESYFVWNARNIFYNANIWWNYRYHRNCVDNKTLGHI